MNIPKISARLVQECGREVLAVERLLHLCKRMGQPISCSEAYDAIRSARRNAGSP